MNNFHFPVRKNQKPVNYTDAYFLRTEEILNGDNHHPRVMMQLFTREPVVVCGIDETIALIKPAHIILKILRSMLYMTEMRLHPGKH